MFCEWCARDMHAFSAKPSVVRVSPEELTCEIPAGRNFHSSPLTRACSIAAEMKDNAHSPEAEDNDRKLCIMVFFNSGKAGRRN